MRKQIDLHGPLVKLDPKAFPHQGSSEDSRPVDAQEQGLSQRHIGRKTRRSITGFHGVSKIHFPFRFALREGLGHLYNARPQDVTFFGQRSATFPLLHFVTHPKNGRARTSVL